ncbi:MAG: universal stress protein [Rhodocyclales bacterium]|nr:universal stress protein [Rhodocyclales bacterium]
MGNLAIMEYLTPDHPAKSFVRLLIPMDATDESRRGLNYAFRLAGSGAQVEVNLLFVAEPLQNWEVLRFYTEDEARKHFQERSAILLEKAAQELAERGTQSRTYFREADSVGGINDLAEELNCSEIAVPKTHWLGLFPSGPGPN